MSTLTWKNWPHHQGTGTKVSGNCVMGIGLARGPQGNKSLWGRVQNYWPISRLQDESSILLLARGRGRRAAYQREIKRQKDTPKKKNKYRDIQKNIPEEKKFFFLKKGMTNTQRIGVHWINEQKIQGDTAWERLRCVMGKTLKSDSILTRSV